MARLTGGPINIVNLDAQNIDNWLDGSISEQSPTEVRRDTGREFPHRIHGCRPDL